MAVAAETQQWTRVDLEYAEVCRQATLEQQAFLGGVAVGASVERPEMPSTETLFSDVQLARLGDPMALRMVRNNVVTQVVESFYKIGENEVELDVRNERLEQEGRSLARINGNSLLYGVSHAEMRDRFKADHRNVLIVESLLPTGMLKTHNAVIFSTSSTKMSNKEKEDWGLYVDTDSVSIQSFSVNGSKATLQTAFVAGKATPDSQRQDVRIIKQMAEESGVLLPTNDGSEMLQYMVLIPKAEMPNGVTNIVQRYDALAGGTFYGEAKPQQDYEQYSRECKARGGKFEGVGVHDDLVMALALAVWVGRGRAGLGTGKVGRLFW